MTRSLPKWRPGPLLTCAAICAAVAVATTLDEALVENYGDCYDPKGLHCTCTDSLELWQGDEFTGTIPSALSACAGLSEL